MHILLVTEDQLTLSLFEDTITHLSKSHTLNTTWTLGEFWEALTGMGAQCEPIPDLLFLDLAFSKSYDHELFEWLAADRQLRSIPIVVISNSDDEEEIRRIYDTQAACLVIMPEHALERLQRVNACIEFWTKHVTLPAGPRYYVPSNCC